MQFHRLMVCCGRGDFAEEGKSGVADDSSFEGEESQEDDYCLEENVEAEDDADYMAVIEIPSQELQEVYEHFSRIGDTVVIVTMDGEVKFSTKSERDTTDVRPGKSTIIKMDEPVSQVFDLQDIMPPQPLTPCIITMRMSQDLPALFEFRKQGYVTRFCLTPEVQEDKDHYNSTQFKMESERIENGELGVPKADYRAELSCLHESFKNSTTI